MALKLGRGKKSKETEASMKKEAVPSKAIDDTSIDAMPPRKMNKFVLAGAITLVAMIAGSVIMAKAYVAEELNRETQAWQVRLGIVADSRVSAVNGWVDDNFKYLRELSQNASCNCTCLNLHQRPRKRMPPRNQAQAPFPLRILFCRGWMAAVPPGAGSVPVPHQAFSGIC